MNDDRREALATAARAAAQLALGRRQWDGADAAGRKSLTLAHRIRCVECGEVTADALRLPSICGGCDSPNVEEIAPRMSTEAPMPLDDLQGRCITQVSQSGPWPVLTLDDGSRVRFVGDYDAAVTVEVYAPGERVPGEDESAALTDERGLQPEWKAYWKVAEEDDRTVESPVAKFVGGPMNGLTVEDQSGDARAFNFDTLEALGSYRRVETDDGVELHWIEDA